MNDLHARTEAFFRTLQDEICTALEQLDGSRFREDQWTHHERGGGRSRVLQEGQLFEKAGVNFSSVAGTFSEDFAKSIPGEGRDFQATGVSLVLHPWSPKIPTVHANFRHLTKGDKQWFGGGADLTPYYPCREDCIHFHQTWKQACDRHATVADYPKLKKWCDEYFYIAHRQECRGIGGIFFDYLENDPEATFAFVQDAGRQFLQAYVPIVERRRAETYTDAERDFQLFRRGRYVEFNLIYDRGTIFGLKTNGRVESILMSLPLNVKWLYDYSPPTGSREADIYEFIKPRDWASL